MATSLIGPSVPDLCEQMDITPADISLAFSIPAAIWTLSGILYGPLIDRYLSYFSLAYSILRLNVNV